jgi:hypothetical protein
MNKVLILLGSTQIESLLNREKTRCTLVLDMEYYTERITGLIQKKQNGQYNYEFFPTENSMLENEIYTKTICYQTVLTANIIEILVKPKSWN